MSKRRASSDARLLELNASLGILQQESPKRARRSSSHLDVAAVATEAAGQHSLAAHQLPRSRYRHVHRTDTRGGMELWKTVITVPVALRTSSNWPRLLVIGSSYQTQEAAARAADLARLALLGVQPGKAYNFPLATYAPEQQQQRTGAELARYLQELKHQRGSAVAAAQAALAAADAAMAGAPPAPSAAAAAGGATGAAAAVPPGAALSSTDDEATEDEGDLPASLAAPTAAADAALQRASAAVAAAESVLRYRRGKLQDMLQVRQALPQTPPCGACAACLTGQRCTASAVQDKAVAASLDVARIRTLDALRGEFWQHAAAADPSSVVPVQPQHALPDQQLSLPGHQLLQDAPSAATAAVTSQPRMLQLCSAAQTLSLARVPFEVGVAVGQLCHSCGALGSHADGRCPAYAPVRQLRVVPPPAASADGSGRAAAAEAGAHRHPTAAGGGIAQGSAAVAQGLQAPPTAAVDAASSAGALRSRSLELEQQLRRQLLVRSLHAAADRLLARDLSRAQSRLHSALHRQQQASLQRQQRQQQQESSEELEAGSSGSQAEDSSKRWQERQQERSTRRAAHCHSNGRHRQQPSHPASRHHGARRGAARGGPINSALQLDGSAFQAIAVVLEELILAAGHSSSLSCC